jgi:hypothetical protein
VRRFLPLLVALGAVAAVVVPYLALGGTSYEPTPVADPCQTREWRSPGGIEAVLEQIVLSGFDGAACQLGVSREDLVLALRDEDALDTFANRHDVSREDAERAVQDALVRAIDDAQDAGALSGSIASFAQKAVEAVPPWLLLQALDSLRTFLP